MTDRIAVDVKTIETALREYLSRLDYDLHKSIESDEETGEDTYDAEAEDLFGYIRDAARQAAGQPTAAEERTPCSFPPCEDGGEPCDRHEREESHADGEHELCGAECPAPGLAAPTNHTTETEEDARHELYDYATITFHDTGIPESVHAYVTRLIATYRTAILNAAADKSEAVAIRLHNAGETTASNGANEAMSALRRLAAGAES